MAHTLDYHDMKNFTYSLFLFALMGILMSGCAGSVGGGQQFHQSVTLPPISVHIVGDRSQLPGQNADGSIMGVMQGNEVWVLGKRTENGLVVNETLLGHEIIHVLQHRTKSIQSPDRVARW